MLENSAECEILNNVHCLYPYPNNHFTVEDPSTDTGLRLNIPAGGIPQPNGDPMDTAEYNALDGFSPVAQILMHFPGGVDLACASPPKWMAAGTNARCVPEP